MNHRFSFLSYLLALCLLCAPCITDAAEPIHIGVLAFRPKVQTQRQWEPLAQILKQQIPEYDFVIDVMTVPEIETAVASRQVDFILNNSGQYILLSRRYGLGAPLATLVGLEEGKASTAFGGVIFSLATRADINTLPDLADKTIAAVSTESLGGYQMQAHELLRLDIRLAQDRRLKLTGMPQDKVVLSVLSAQADVGFVRTGVLERMAKEGLLDISKIKVINSQNLAEFPQRVSTRLYPEWPFSPLPHTDENLSRRVAAALLLLSDNPNQAQLMGIKGFTVPADYTPVLEVLRDLRMPPFDISPRFTWRDVWVRYQQWLILMSVAFGIIVLLGIRLLVSNQRLAKAGVKAEKDAEQLRLSASVFAHSYEGIMVTSAKNIILDVNPAFERITGYSREEAVGQTPLLLHSGQHPPEFYANMWRELKENHYWQGEVWNKHKGGNIYPQMLAISSVKDATGAVAHYVAVFSDISAFKEHQAELDQLAHFDPLTGIPNRRLLGDRLAQAITRSLRSKKLLAVCYLDLDGFKPINDNYGHDFGDNLLIEITQRLKQILRAEDTLARLGGDEFVLLLGGLSEHEDNASLYQRILDTVSDPISIQETTVQVSASMGITVFPTDHVDVDTRLRHADQAMYVAKQGGKNRYCNFDALHDLRIQERQASLKQIEAALHNQEFVLFYQPKVDLKTYQTTGVEALIRWQHPERGLLPPAAFLPLIEHSDLEIPLGQWVIDTALNQYEEWLHQDVDLEISINIAASHLQWKNFSNDLRTRLEKHPAIKSHRLQIEILETTALADFSHVANVIHECEAFGVSFALDDFGTGYSSLTYLRNLPSHTIKIDQSFVRNMLNDMSDRAIVEGTIALARTFKRQTVAEGVETMEHFQVLKEMGCELAQGYGIARPMPANQIPLFQLTHHTAEE